MHMIILAFHIMLATLMTGATVRVFIAARGQRTTSAYPAMLSSFALTVMSGVSLLFVTSGNFGRVCVTMTAFSVLVLAARAYYRKRSLVSLNF